VLPLKNKIVVQWLSFLYSLSLSIVAVAEIDKAVNSSTGRAPDPVEHYKHLDNSRIQLGSVKAAVFDLVGATLLYSKNADVQVPIASITKLMTAMVVLDSEQPLDEMLTISKVDRESSNNGYSRMRIGSRLSRGDLLRVMLMASENLAASNLAVHYPGGFAAFIAAMNIKAQALGMTQTRFVDASGLSIKNVSTAADLVKMVAAAVRYEAIRDLSTTGSFTARFENPRYRLHYVNTNSLVRRNGWDVGLSKTGYLNEAGRCLVMITAIDGRDVAMVLLDSFGKLTPLGDAGRIKRWLTTGASGAVAGAALTYERNKSSK
jgi:serine-type D-Ala-D-Ala endopeptidase (penicillin-binding protein 7)